MHVYPFVSIVREEKKHQQLYIITPPPFINIAYDSITTTRFSVLKILTPTVLPSLEPKTKAARSVMTLMITSHHKQLSHSCQTRD